MTENAQNFVKANKLSPVVSGTAIGNGGQGAHYTLRDGRTFTLTAAECRQVGEPRWDIPRR